MTPKIPDMGGGGPTVCGQSTVATGSDVQGHAIRERHTEEIRVVPTLFGFGSAGGVHRHQGNCVRHSVPADDLDPGRDV